MAALKVGTLGDYIRDQRKSAQYSLRQLADAAGVSNPYLSQVERGLKKPSAEILQQIAKALRISAETLYVRAGLLEERGSGSDVVAAVLADKQLAERHKRVLIDIYESFRGGAEQTAQPRAIDTRKRATTKRPAAGGATKRPAPGATTTKRTTTRRKSA
jgi:transcriptional regulator with XRE-family HTH domain